MQPIEGSSQLAAAGFALEDEEAQTGTLRVRFCSGAEYDYAQVPAETYAELLAAESVGRFFNRTVKPRFICSKVGAAASRYAALGNRAMARKLETGEAIDLAGAARLGPYYVVEAFREGVDYCDSAREAWIWSIGRAERDLQWPQADGSTLLVRAGTALASCSADFYRLEGFVCLWLR